MKNADVEYIISSFKGIVVIDEAYIDFSEKPSFKPLFQQISQPDSDADFQQSIRTGSGKGRNGFYKQNNYQLFQQNETSI